MRKNPFVFGGKHFESVSDISFDDIYDEIRNRKNKKAKDYVLSGGHLTSEVLDQFWEEACRAVFAYLDMLAEHHN